jgi:hypothetical protein
MRDRCVAPVERDAAGSEDIARVHVGVVDAGGDAQLVEFRAPLAQPRPQPLQRLVLAAGDAAGRIDRLSDDGVPEQLLKLAGDAARAQVGQPEGEQARGLPRQVGLQPGVPAQHRRPPARVRRRRLLLLAQRGPAVAGQRPGAVQVDRDRRGEPVGLPGRQRHQQRGLEPARGRARLEPDGPAAGRDPGDHGVRPCPRPHRAGALDRGPRALGVDPVLGRGEPLRVLPRRSSLDGFRGLQIGDLHGACPPSVPVRETVRAVSEQRHRLNAICRKRRIAVRPGGVAGAGLCRWTLTGGIRAGAARADRVLTIRFLLLSFGPRRGGQRRRLRRRQAYCAAASARRGRNERPKAFAPSTAITAR